MGSQLDKNMDNNMDTGLNGAYKHVYVKLKLINHTVVELCT